MIWMILRIDCWEGREEWVKAIEIVKRGGVDEK